MSAHRMRTWHFYAAALAGIVAYAVAWLFSAPVAFTVGADVFFVIYSGLTLRDMRRMTPAYLHRKARSADLPVFLIFAVTLLIVAVAVGSLFVAINISQAPDRLALTLALLSIPLGWFTIQAMVAVHYAHLYWIGDADDLETEKGLRRAGGLDFPGDHPPGGFDFLYFSVTVGMTAQTADVSITSSRLRATVLVHAIVSFFFNAVIVAAAVNLAVSLGN